MTAGAAAQALDPNVVRRNWKTFLWIVVAGLAGWAMATHLPLAVNGLLLGCIYALGAIGMTLVFGNLGFANIAHGDYMTFGAYIALFVQAHVLPGAGRGHGSVGPFTFNYSLFGAIPAAAALTAALALALDTLIYKRLRGRRAASAVMALASLGVAIAIRGAIQMIWGTQPQQFPRVSAKFFMLPGDVRIPPDMLFAAAAALALTLGVYYLLARTRLGKAMRATADNQMLAQVSGIDTEMVTRWTWVIGAALAATAGILLALVQAQLLPNLGWKVLIPIFAAVILGGIGNPRGALIGALVIAVAGEVSTAWMNPAYKPAVSFAVLFVVLLVRPRGIFGGRS